MVEFILNNEKSYMSEIYAPVGESKDIVDLNWIIEKFKRITKSIISEKKQECILSVLSDVDNVSVQEIANLINNDI